MHTLLRGLIVVCALAAIGLTWPALAAPERLNDDVPSAFPDDPGAWAFSYGHETIDLEGALTSSRTAHDYFKLRYTFSPKVAAAVRYSVHDLNNGFALVNPLLNDHDSGNSFEVDLRTNLLNVPMTPADEESQQEFAAGSAFSLGVSGTFYQLDAGNLGRDENLIKAYLLYTTDLTEEMRAHTYFSSGRLAGDTSSGSVNRIGAGIDYVLIPGDRPLALMANGILDIYNFREPSFNTSRVSRFDVGLRYRVGHDWFASLGWVTVNDSENDASGSGVFAGLNFVDMPRPQPECPPVEEVSEGTPAEGEAAPASASAAQQIPANLPTDTTPAEAAPVLMAGAGYSGSVNRSDPTQVTTAPDELAAASTERIVSRNASNVDSNENEPGLTELAGLREPQPAVSGFGPAEITGGPYYFDPERAEQNEQAVAELDAQLTQTSLTDEDTIAGDATNATNTEDSNGGISIPPFPEIKPRHTPLQAVMVRAGLALPQEVPHPTLPEQQMTRAPHARAEPPASMAEAASDVDEALEEAITEDKQAIAGSGKAVA